jgi:hypothetical protein
MSLSAKKLSYDLARPPFNERAEKAQGKSELPQDCCHRHFGSASRSILAFYGQPKARLRNPGSENTLSPHLGKNSSFRFGHNFAGKTLRSPNEIGFRRDSSV